MSSQQESFSPDKNLGSKMFEPSNPEVVIEINKAALLFREKLGPASSKFVELLIMEEENEASMITLAQSFQKIADEDPFILLDYTDSKTAFINLKIEEAKRWGEASGIGEQNNLKLKVLGKAGVLTNDASWEIVRKYPVRYLAVRKSR